jgi:hypothetical protein
MSADRPSEHAKVSLVEGMPGLSFMREMQLAGLDLTPAHCDVLLGRPFLENCRIVYEGYGRNVNVISDLLT